MSTAADFLTLEMDPNGRGHAEVYFRFADAEKAMRVRNGKKIVCMRVANIECVSPTEYQADANEAGDYVSYPTFDAARDAAMAYAAAYVTALPLWS